MLEKIKAKAAKLKREIFALYLAVRDPRTPWYAKVLVACVVAYALSPIDLIPDPIPVLGYLDDLVLLPLGIWLALRMIPLEVMQDCRARAASSTDALPRNWWAATAVVLLWIIALILIGYFLVQQLSIDAISDSRYGY